jgi:hypothetical protein
VPAEPTVLMTFECAACGGTGERTEYFAGAGAVMSPSGGALPCQTCHGQKTVEKRVTVSELGSLLDEHTRG